MLALAAFFLLGAVLGGMVAARGASAMGGELRRYLEGYLALRIEGAPSSAAVWQTMVCFFRASVAVFLLGFASAGVALIPAVCAAQASCTPIRFFASPRVWGRMDFSCCLFSSRCG